MREELLRVYQELRCADRRGVDVGQNVSFPQPALVNDPGPDVRREPREEPEVMRTDEAMNVVQRDLDQVQVIRQDSARQNPGNACTPEPTDPSAFTSKNVATQWREVQDMLHHETPSVTVPSKGSWPWPRPWTPNRSRQICTGEHVDGQLPDLEPARKLFPTPGSTDLWSGAMVDTPRLRSTAHAASDSYLDVNLGRDDEELRRYQYRPGTVVIVPPGAAVTPGTEQCSARDQAAPTLQLPNRLCRTAGHSVRVPCVVRPVTYARCHSPLHVVGPNTSGLGTPRVPDLGRPSYTDISPKISSGVVTPPQLSARGPALFNPFVGISSSETPTSPARTPGHPGQCTAKQFGLGKPQTHCEPIVRSRSCVTLRSGVLSAPSPSVRPA